MSSAWPALSTPECCVGDILGIGVAECINNSGLGPLYIETNLEPLIKAAEERLKRHQDSGEMIRRVDSRMAALTLVSPLIVGYLHQRKLGGEKCEPLDLDEFAKQHTKSFVRAFSV